MGQLRFCLRKDVDPASYGSLQCEEVHGHEPHGSDILLIAKRRMADAEPCRVVCVVPVSVSAALRASFEQPRGNTERRPIGESVVKNIKKRAPQAQKQGAISMSNVAHLLGRVDGTLPRIPRPTAYKVLELRRYELGFSRVPPRAWSAPQRARVLTVLKGDGSRVDSDSDDAAENCPIEDTDFL